MRVLLALFSALAIVFAPHARADSFNDAQKQDIQTIVHDYLLAHPEMLKEMVQKLDAQEKKAAAEAQTAAITSSGKDIYHNDIDAVVGNPKGDVTLVEFMDYNCGYCKKDFAEIQAIVAHDPKLRVVMKEWPVIGGDDSVYAARAAMAAAKQGKYWPLHQAMFTAEGHVSPKVVDRLAESLGIDVAKMKADMKDEAITANLGKTQALADSLNFTGTPGFLVGDIVFPGYSSQQALMAAIAEIRAKGGCQAC